MTIGSYKQFCPVAMAAEILCTRWTVVLLRELIAGSTRFNELRRGVPRMSPALLSQRLKELEVAGIVTRKSGSERGVFEYQLTAAGLFRVITVKTRFDETTISPTRGSAVLYPNSRVAVVVDANGKQYFPEAEAEHLLEGLNQAGMPFSTPLRPGESYQTAVVFDLPADIQSPTLLIHEGGPETRFVIGHENSLLHKKTKFQI